MSTTMFVIVVAPACCCCCCCSCSSSCCSYCCCSCCWWPLPANEAHNKHGPKNPSLALSLSLTFPLPLSFPPFAPVACHNIDRTRKVAALSRGRHSRLCCTALPISLSLSFFSLSLTLSCCLSASNWFSFLLFFTCRHCFVQRRLLLLFAHYLTTTTTTTRTRTKSPQLTPYRLQAGPPSLPHPTATPPLPTPFGQLVRIAAIAALNLF